jgi:thioredoxin reductase (NADPH)
LTRPSEEPDPEQKLPLTPRQGEALHPKLVEGEVRVIGPRWSPRVHEIKAFLARSRVPYRWLDNGRDEDARAAAEQAGARDRFPVVLLPDGSVLFEPEVREVARKLGLETDPDSRFYDLITIGGGPAGLAASINGASEGIRTLVLEQEVPGGQISYSAIVENYPGFPEGLSGSDLARRTVEQAERFGVEILVLRRAVGLREDGESHVVTLDDGAELHSRAVLLAVGVSFRWLDVPGCAPLVGAGIYYGAAIAEASACRGQDIYILGGGNSAGQAALLLAQFARRVIILALEDTIEETMSKYLVDRLRQLPNVEIRTNTTVVGADGRGRLEEITIENVKTGKKERARCDGLFVFIGATPRTEWLEEVVRRDEKGFILSGADVRCDISQWPEWPLKREPYRLETSMPGVFVAGDVRKGSIKRLAAAVGEGAMAIQFIHQYGKAKHEAAGQRGSGAVPPTSGVTLST